LSKAGFNPSVYLVGTSNKQEMKNPPPEKEPIEEK